jgi:hypothetical protein
MARSPSRVIALPPGPFAGSAERFPHWNSDRTFNGNITVVLTTHPADTVNVPLKINAAGGGGNGGASFGNTSLADGRVGTVYLEQLTIAAGVGPFTFGAKDLPPGISLNGLTGVLSGTPTAAGRYYVTLSAYDAAKITTPRGFCRFSSFQASRISNSSHRR